MPEISPTARALRTLEILQNRPRTTADELAERLGVTERAARRYVEILREAGIGVDSSRGPHGGYRLRRGTRLPPIVFTQAEALSLVMAVLDGHPEATDATDSVGSALGKVIEALPDAVANRAAALRDHVCGAPNRFPTRPDPGITSSLVAAIAAQRGVLIEYQSEPGRQWTAEVDPWAVVVRHGRWYLLCRSRANDARRAYRVDRVRAVTVLDEVCTPPADLDPIPMLEQHLAAGWEYEVEVAIDAPLDAVARCVPRTLGQLQPLDADHTRLVGSTSNPGWYAEQLATIPAPYRIVRCPELQQAAQALGQRLLAAAGG